jgi:hypothetical protein
MAWQPPPPPPKPGGPGGPGYGGGGPGYGGGSGSKPQPGPSSSSENYYEMLQVDFNAHATIIRYAYRFLAGIYHPDNAETGNAEMFRQITEAFKTLSDSGKRAAYDLKIGPMLAAKAAGASAATPGAKPDPGLPKPKTGNPLPTLDRTSVSYNEVELRLACLQLMLQARKRRVQTGGCSAKQLMDVLGTEMAEMEFALWYLREAGFIERSEAQFMITVKGVDYLVDSLSKTQIIEQGPKHIPTPPGGANLPAVR